MDPTERNSLIPGLELQLADWLSQTLNRYSIVAVTDRKGRIIFANDNFCEISKYTREELLGQDHRIVNSGHHPKSFFKEMWGTILAGRTWHGEVKNRAKDGTYYWVDTHIVPYFKNGEITHLVAVRVDITARKSTEEQSQIQQEQLLLADKMASLGILTSGVAHEINNPNHLILANCDLLARLWPDITAALDLRFEGGDFAIGGNSYGTLREEIPQILSRIKEGSLRIKNIVDSLKNFSRAEDGSEKRPISINVLIKTALVLVEATLRKATLRFELQLAEDLPNFMGQFQQIEQVVINLLTNAAEALPDRSRGIYLSTYFNREKERIVVEVQDEGEGIPQDILARIVEPFFSTKRQRGGTGLGLYISHGIVQNHGGELSFISRVGSGTTALVMLPPIVASPPGG